MFIDKEKTRLDKKLMKIFLDQKVFGTDLLRECSSLRQCLTLPTNYMTSRNRVNFWLELDLCVGFQTHTCKSHIILSFIFFGIGTEEIEEWKETRVVDSLIQVYYLGGLVTQNDDPRQKWRKMSARADLANNCPQRAWTDNWLCFFKNKS
jgi:hypothetical protein